MHSSLVVAARRRALCNGPRREKKSLYDRSEAAVVCYMPLSAFPILHFMQKMKPAGRPKPHPKLNNIGISSSTIHTKIFFVFRLKSFPRSSSGQSQTHCWPQITFFFCKIARIFTGFLGLVQQSSCPSNKRTCFGCLETFQLNFRQTRLPLL